MIKFSRYLDDEFRCIVDNVIQRNAFFAHSEKILLAMLTDDRVVIRELAYRRFIAARKEHASSTKIRQFRVPNLNFEADDYTNLVMWQAIDRCEPPLTMSMTDDELQMWVRTLSLIHISEPTRPY